ncbi:drug/metabolite transporter (DMT)-like permease [Sinorhizobium fredii]
MDKRFSIGVFAALFAAFAFSLNFIVPFIIGDYSTFDFALVRHVVSALVGLCILFSGKGVMQHLTLRNWLSTTWLAFIGYVGYFLTVTGAAIFAGPVIAPAFLGLVPIVLAIIGNQRQGSLPWRFLMMPLMLVLIGLVLVNGSAFTAEGLKSVRSLWIGIPLALAAVALWVWFAIANEAAIATRPEMPSAVWSALTLVGGGVLMLAFYPIGAAMHLFQLPRLGFEWNAAGWLYLWGISLALLATVGGRVGVECRLPNPARRTDRAIDRRGNRLRRHWRAHRSWSMADRNGSHRGRYPDRRGRPIDPCFP